MYKKEDFAWLTGRAYNKYSQFGEDGIIEAIFQRIGPANKWVMECGAADGMFFSNSRKLIEDGWSGVLIEGDKDLYDRLEDTYAFRNPKGGAVHLYKSMITACGNCTLEGTLEHAQAPLDLDLAVIDVDGQDYWLFNSLLKYKPRVVMVEFDPNAEPGFIPPVDGDGQAGLDAIIKLGVGKYYYPVCATACNVIFVHQELVSMVAGAGGAEITKETFDRVVSQIEKREPEAAQKCLEKQRWKRQLHDFFAGLPNASMTSEDIDRIAEQFVSFDRGEQPLAAPLRCEAESKPASLKIAGVISIPQLGHNVHHGCQAEALGAFGISVRQCYGAYWNQALTEGIRKVLEQGADYVLTLDYDALFTAQHVADLVTLAMDHPEYDVIIPCMTKREGNGLLAHTKNQDPSVPGVNLNDPIIPIQLGHFGLTLFKRSVFDRLDKPWMVAEPDKDGFWGGKQIDADMNFWLNCDRNGVKVGLARFVRVGHIEYMATIPNEKDPRKTDYVHVGEWRKWAAEVNHAVAERLATAKGQLNAN